MISLQVPIDVKGLKYVNELSSRISVLDYKSIEIACQLFGYDVVMIAGIADYKPV